MTKAGARGQQSRGRSSRDVMLKRQLGGCTFTRALDTAASTSDINRRLVSSPLFDGRKTTRGFLAYSFAPPFTRTCTLSLDSHARANHAAAASGAPPSRRKRGGKWGEKRGETRRPRTAQGSRQVVPAPSGVAQGPPGVVAGAAGAIPGPRAEGAGAAEHPAAGPGEAAAV